MPAHPERPRRLTTVPDTDVIDLLHASLRRVAFEPDPVTALAEITQEAANTLGARDSIVMYRSGDHLVATAPSESVRSVAAPLGRAAFLDEPRFQLPSVRAILQRLPVVITDVRDCEGPPGFREACAAVGVQAVLVQPTVTPAGTPIALNLGFASETDPTPEQLRIAAGYADLAGIALDRVLAGERERETSSKLIELNELYADFLSTVSHELRTPLTAIHGFSETLIQRWTDMTDHLRRDLTDRIRRESIQLDRLIGELLDYAKLERQTVAVRLRPLDLAVQIPRTVGALEFALSRHHVDIHVPHSLVVMAEQDAWGRVLGNLLTNAAKFSPPGTHITVSAVPRGETAVIRVEDEGSGIPEADRERVFERFYRVERGDKAAGGTGIGLAIVRHYVEAMHGEAWVEAAPGGGAAVCFTLPRAS